MLRNRKVLFHTGAVAEKPHFMRVSGFPKAGMETHKRRHILVRAEVVYNERRNYELSGKRVSPKSVQYFLSWPP